jgi:hypothetical protein
MDRGIDTESCKKLPGARTAKSTWVPERMLDAGLVEECTQRDVPGGDERRRYYRLTSKGRAPAVSEAERLERLLSSAYSKALIPRPRSV